MKPDRGGILVWILLLSACVIPATPATAECGRCFSRCIDAVNLIRKACEDRCALNCAALFPADETMFDACRSSCNAVCVDQSEDAKLLCRITRDPIPEEP